MTLFNFLFDLILFICFLQNLKVAVPESISADLGKYFMLVLSFCFVSLRPTFVLLLVCFNYLAVLIRESLLSDTDPVS